MTKYILQNCAYAILTDDDPHNEDEEAILRDMLQDCTCTNYEICLDRKRAIGRGIDLLAGGDTLLILGKGHEDFIVMKDRLVPHNDKEAVREYVRQKKLAASKPMGVGG